MNIKTDITTNGFKDLRVYRKAVELSILTLRLTRDFPTKFQYDLGSQMRRAAISVPSNISEGYRRNSRKEYIQFLSIAYGSCGELQSQTEIASAMDLFSKNDGEQILNVEDEVSKMLWKMIDRMKGWRRV